MRSKTMRLASALFRARRTVIPLASSAAAVRLTRASSAGTANRRLSVLSRSGWTSIMRWSPHRSHVLALASTLCSNLLHVQKHSPLGDVAALIDRLIEKSLPGRRGEPAWRALLQAHATLIRQLDTDLRNTPVSASPTSTSWLSWPPPTASYE